MTDQTTPLRDRIAAALYPTYGQEDRNRSLAIADAVLAVLPAPADRAAVLREAADVAERVATLRHRQHEIEREQGALDVMTQLRRMADETATTETQARRGDAFEAWLKAQRDRYDRHGESSEFWHEFDRALDEYRLHADLGTPLDGHVCEGKIVGDCECLEQPTAKRQDGASS